jgi:rhamnosyltransferase
MKASIIIRTYNEAKHLPDVLNAIQKQEGVDAEIILVDSGSTDGTLHIAERSGCRIIHIGKEIFSFGRSLNMGCAAAAGDILVFVSGHCIPADNQWLKNLTAPIEEGIVEWTYGRQVGIAQSRFSEQQIFHKYYPAVSSIPQGGFFCNNANGALLKKVWEQYPFDEELTGLEDMHLAKQIVQAGMKLGYVSEANVFHIHNETWRKIRNRFEREAIALQHIMPAVHVSFFDFLRYVISSIALDAGKAMRQKIFLKKVGEILLYRTCQYWGSYQGNHSHRKLSRKLKERYFFPR